MGQAQIKLQNTAAQSKAPLLTSAVKWVPERVCPTMVGWLLEAGVAVDQVDIKYGRTALWVASAQGHDAVVRQLLQKGATVDQADHSGSTPLHAAARAGCEAIVGQLLVAGAEID